MRNLIDVQIPHGCELSVAASVVETMRPLCSFGVGTWTARAPRVRKIYSKRNTTPQKNRRGPRGQVTQQSPAIEKKADVFL